MCIVARKKENAQQALNIVQTIISIVQDFYPVLDDMGHPVRPYRIALGIAPYITISGAQLNAYAELLALRLFELGHGNHFASIRKEVNAAAAHQLYFVLPSAEDMREHRFPQSVYVMDPAQGIGDRLPVRMKERDLVPYVHDLVTIFGLYKGTPSQARQLIYNRIMQAARPIAQLPAPMATANKRKVAPLVPAAAGGVRKEVPEKKEKGDIVTVILDSD
jgi:hypothetical protein